MTFHPLLLFLYKKGVDYLVDMKSKKRNNMKIKSSVFDTIFLSEKRKDVLFLLKKEGPKTSDDIKDAFDFPWKSMAPQIKRLIDWRLVLEDDNKYVLSDVGSMITSNMQSFLNTLYLYEKNLDFWSDHDLSSIPLHMLSRIGELGDIEIIDIDASKLFIGPKEITKYIVSSKHILCLSSIFYPSSPSLYYKIIEKNMDIIYIYTKSVIEIMQTEYKDILFEDTNNSVVGYKLSEYKQRIKQILDNKDSNIMIYEGKLIPALMIITDEILLLSLMDKKGRLSTKYLIASEPQALIWAEELFMYYREKSKPLSSSVLACCGDG